MASENPTLSPLTKDGVPFAKAEILLNTLPFERQESMTEFNDLSYAFNSSSQQLQPSFETFDLPDTSNFEERLNSRQMKDLKSLGFPTGLAEAMNLNRRKFPLRVWIVDNSGSMKQDDGSRIIFGNNKVKMVQCTRWKEMVQTLEFHTEFVGSTLESPTIFRLLNRPLSKKVSREFKIGFDTAGHEIKSAQDIIHNLEPKGCTPLSKRVLELRDNIMQHQELLEHREQRIAIILATDGLPTNQQGLCSHQIKQEFVSALRSLEGLPVWVVIRLCTQNDEVVDFYNNLDCQLEIELEVLDDFLNEAQEIYEHNKWINYALPLHRAREMGFHHRMFDLLDERRLTLDEVREYFTFLFNPPSNSLPDPVVNFKGFLKAAQKLLQKEPKQYNPISKKETPWVDLKKLAKAYKETSCQIM